MSGHGWSPITETVRWDVLAEGFWSEGALSHWCSIELNLPQMRASRKTILDSQFQFRFLSWARRMVQGYFRSLQEEGIFSVFVYLLLFAYLRSYFWGNNSEPVYLRTCEYLTIFVNASDYLRIRLSESAFPKNSPASFWSPHCTLAIWNFSFGFAELFHFGTAKLPN